MPRTAKQMRAEIKAYVAAAAPATVADWKRQDENGDGCFVVDEIRFRLERDGRCPSYNLTRVVLDVLFRS